MSEHCLQDELNESIVDGIINGYRDYLDVRREKARDLKVSAAYAWVKGNHIDHYVALACEKHEIKSELHKAGMTWKYLQFHQSDEKTLFIVKNARYFNTEEVDKGKDAKGRTRANKSTYMENLIKINKNIKFDGIPAKSFNGSEQLELLEDFKTISLNSEDTNNIDSHFDRFYIATYKIDENHYIGEIRIWMPNPANNKAYLISDLSSYIGKKPSHVFEIEEDLISILTHTQIPEEDLDATAFGIVLHDTEEQES